MPPPLRRADSVFWSTNSPSWISSLLASLHHTYHSLCCTLASRFSEFTHFRSLSIALHLTSLPNMDDTVAQGRVLCREFLYSRLRRQNLLSLKVELQGAARRQTDVGCELLTLAAELEHLHPNLYRNVCRQLNVVLSSEATVTTLYSGIADAMFRGGNGPITWGRVVALFTVTSALATECIQQGHPEFVKHLVDGFVKATRNHLATWIIKQGGWTTLGRVFRGSRETPALWALTGAGALFGFLATIATSMYT